jgi:hypothetical protein
MVQLMTSANGLYLFRVVVLQRSRKGKSGKKAFVVILSAAKDPEELNFHHNP